MKYLNHFNKHLGGTNDARWRGIVYPIQKGKVEIVMLMLLSFFFFNCHSGQFVVNSEKKKLWLMLLVANSFSRRLMQM